MKRKSLPSDNQLEEGLNAKEEKKIPQLHMKQFNPSTPIVHSSRFFKIVSNETKNYEIKQKNSLHPQVSSSPKHFTYIPEELECPLTLEIMVHPVLCTLDGITYEEKEIREWLTKMRNSPITRHAMKKEQVIDDILINNRNLEQVIGRFRKDNPHLFVKQIYKI